MESEPAAHPASRPSDATACARLLAGASIELLARHAEEAGELRELLPPGTPIFLPALPQQALQASLDGARAIARAGFEPVPHIAARKLVSAAELRLFLRAVTAESRVTRVLLVGGDLPQSLGPFDDALAVLREGGLGEAGLRGVLLAGYPEGHPTISEAALAQALDEKLALARTQGLEPAIVTQFSFAPARIAAWCGQLARRHPGLAVHVGIAGPTDPVALLKYAQRCGVSASRRALRHLGSGIARLVINTDPAEQVAALAHYCEGKAPCNVAGLHFFAFGGALRTARWLQSLQQRGGSRR